MFVHFPKLSSGSVGDINLRIVTEDHIFLSDTCIGDNASYSSTALIRTAGVPEHYPNEKYCRARQMFPMTVNVMEPEEMLVLAASGAYRIPPRACSLNPPSPVQGPSKRKAAFLADRVAKEQMKTPRRVPICNKTFCKLYHVSCVGSKASFDHIQFRSQ